MRTQCSWKIAPASVRLSLRVVRFSSFTDSERSSALTWRLTSDFEMPSRAAAAEKLFASTTSANTLMAARRSCNSHHSGNNHLNETLFIASLQRSTLMP